MGKRLRRKTKDVRQAESLYIFVLFSSMLALVLVQYVVWAFIEPAVKAAPLGATAVIFWAGQIAVIVLFAATCVIGFQPSIQIWIDRNTLTIDADHKSRVFKVETFNSVTFIDALVHHQHYRRYAETRAFVNKVPETLLLIWTPTNPIILGLDPGDQEAVSKAIARATKPVASITEPAVLV